MNKVTIYTTSGCPYCIKAKKLLKLLNLEYNEIDASNAWEKMQQDLSEKFAIKDISTVPQIIINDKYVGGYDDLEAAFKKDSLSSYLN